MEKIIIQIDKKHKNLYFKELLEEYGYNGLIPTDCFIDKVRPGIGGTAVEIESLRNSIIIVPFVDVGEVKKIKYGDKLCIVMNGISDAQIKLYLLNDTNSFKKIITTPDSFLRMIKVLSKHDKNYRSNYFLLYDESDKLIDDCLFRNKLLSPLDEFFSFIKRAFISATPIVPSDPRLVEHKFKHLVFMPKWDYRKNLKLITTDNITTSIRNYLTLLKDERPVFVFTNCKKTILYMARLEGVNDDYTVFCSEELDDSFFKNEGLENIKYSVKKQSYSKINFFTSRSFSSLDIITHYKPHILMVTNLPFIKHSVINPSTTAVQIQGRCRNGVSSITHISSLYSGISIKTSEEISSDMDFSITFVDKLKLSALAFKHKGVQLVLEELTNKNFVKAIYDNDGIINSYFKDAFINNEHINNCYVRADMLIDAYKRSGYFNVEAVDVKHIFSEQDRLALDNLRNQRRARLVANKFYEIECLLNNGTSINKDDINEFEKLISEEPIIFCLYCKLGLAFLELIKFQNTKMRKAFFKLTLDERKFVGSSMIDEIIFTFPTFRRLNSDSVKCKLAEIYEKYAKHIGYDVAEHACATHILRYFEGTYNNGKKKHSIHGYKSYYWLTKPKFSLSKDLSHLEAMY